jgi:HSP20 family molecular chaperone IbpA
MMSAEAGIEDDETKRLADEQVQREKEAREQAALPYKWKQTLQDVDVTVPVPAGTRGRQLNVVIERQHLTVGLKGSEPIIDVCLLIDDYGRKYNWCA